MPFQFLGVFLCCFALSVTEPTCSRFHYEEQTLKKMLMVEMLVENLKGDLEETKKIMNSVVEDIESDRETLKQRFEDIQTSLSEDISRNRKDTGNKNEILFRARNIKDRSPSRGETIVFQTALTNIGSAYDHRSGIFTAPVAGLYMFTLQLCVTDEKYLYFDIVVDDEPILRSMGADDADKWNTGDSYSTAAILKPGAKVWVKFHHGSAECICTNSDHWNMFHGFLIH